VACQGNPPLARKEEIGKAHLRVSRWIRWRFRSRGSGL